MYLIFDYEDLHQHLLLQNNSEEVMCASEGIIMDAVELWGEFLINY